MDKTTTNFAPITPHHNNNAQNMRMSGDNVRQSNDSCTNTPNINRDSKSNSSNSNYMMGGESSLPSYGGSATTTPLPHAHAPSSVTPYSIDSIANSTETATLIDYSSNNNNNHQQKQQHFFGGDLVRNPDGTLLLDHKNNPISIAKILATKPLRSELATRPGPGNRKLTYLSGDSVTRTLNDVFGFDGWCLEIKETRRESCEKDSKGRYMVSYTSHVRVTHRISGAFKEDCGAGDSIDKSLGTAVSHALKASVTDAMKRAVRHFGDKLGNSLYESKFSVNNAPKSLTEALIQYDIERAKSKFGFEKDRIAVNSATGCSSAAPSPMLIHTAGKSTGNNTNITYKSTSAQSSTSPPTPVPAPVALQQQKPLQQQKVQSSTSMMKNQHKLNNDNKQQQQQQQQQTPPLQQQQQKKHNISSGSIPTTTSKPLFNTNNGTFPPITSGTNNKQSPYHKGNPKTATKPTSSNNVTPSGGGVNGGGLSRFQQLQQSSLIQENHPLNTNVYIQQQQQQRHQNASNEITIGNNGKGRVSLPVTNKPNVMMDRPNTSRGNMTNNINNVPNHHLQQPLSSSSSSLGTTKIAFSSSFLQENHNPNGKRSLQPDGKSLSSITSSSSNLNIYNQHPRPIKKAASMYTANSNPYTMKK